MPTRVLEDVPVGDATSETSPASAATAPPQSRAMVESGRSMQQATGDTSNGNACLQLTLGGVAFSLFPSMNPEGQVTFQAISGTGATLKLNNFTGDLTVSITSSANAEQNLSRPLLRQESVTPSPTETNKRSFPLCQQRMLQHASGASPEAAGALKASDSQAPTPTMANVSKQQASKRHHSASQEVEQVKVASRTSPLPHHSPVKRSRSNGNGNANKKSKMLSQQLPPSPIALQKSQQSPGLTQQSPGLTQQSPGLTQQSPGLTQQSPGLTQRSSSPEQRSPNMLMSQQELHCSQPSFSCSQRSNDSDDEDEQVKQKQLSQSSSSHEPELATEAEDVRDKETVEQMEPKEDDNDEEESVATLKPDDFPEEDEMEEEKKEDKEDTVMDEADDDEETKEEAAITEKEPVGDGKAGEQGTTGKDKPEEDADEEAAAEEEIEMQLEETENTAADTAQETTTATQSPTKHDVPCARWGHTMTMIDHNRILVYGGQAYQTDKDKEIVAVTKSDVHVFSLDSKSWFKPQMSSESSMPRQWHSATFLPERDLLVCFGGEVMNPKTGRLTTFEKNALMCLDTEILLWYPPHVSGDMPSGRSGHCATLLPSSANNELVIFGGTKGGKFLNTVSVLDTNKWVWNTPKIQGMPPRGRSYATATAVQSTQAGVIGGHQSDTVSSSKHAMINIKHRIVIFGGNEAHQSFDTCHVLEKTEGVNTTWRWHHPAVTGTPPKPRTGHSATLMEDQKTICIYGGWDPTTEDSDTPGDDNIFQDSFLLDTEKWTWTAGPSPVFGGLSPLDLSLQNEGARRVGHTAVKIPNQNQVLAFGGRVPEDVFAGDFQTLSMANN
ncbi:Host cell factor 1 [Seminavis robusta]|uniref:Host cell factor 1 n=1 Tax=Seminavis robusta TaxID=568900 RepID=A0A9N8DIU0_9STRA|nr:Host cell factor 1 [Seminavis robusta]|eukprot:Sro150_g068950.1 Host cell factor 1 (838) ;mRNA; r:87701-90390